MYCCKIHTHTAIHTKGKQVYSHDTRAMRACLTVLCESTIINTNVDNVNLFSKTRAQLAVSDNMLIVYIMAVQSKNDCGWISFIM